ncbi:hypothetical protein BJY04DRAFT_192611 [Aspergillus karnatakaensis]|uniref:uncharacterized protein n=1 Tax=Aspergillus karnatakaensis TaxID=1810916 RepID=UPI003CCD664D
MPSANSEPSNVSITEQCSLPFQPKPQHRVYTPLFNDNVVPKFLYRLVAPQTAGTTTASSVVPPVKSGNMPDIFQLPETDAAALLLNHLLWQRGHEAGCNLISWTSSLMFALQYALYRHQKDGADLRNIYLIVLDTSQFQPGTFIQDMEIMYSFQAADRGLRKFVEFRESEYYFGEYLTQGRLDIQGRCACTPVQKMIDLGLFELQPGLAEKEQWRWWPKRVLDLRQLFYSGICMPTTEGEMETAVDIARECFGEQWIVAGAIMLLALQPRKHDDIDLIQAFKTRFTVADIGRARLDRITVVEKRLPEVRQFKELIESVQRSYVVSDYDSLVLSVKELGV